ncbi:uncharacterized protein [Prorops nasuta]|uniref:uncharacterized protein n=1 Tax=Prorops nasuta TaxID=863751 RepID=UPI0034CEDF89
MSTASMSDLEDTDDSYGLSYGEEKPISDLQVTDDWEITGEWLEKIFTKCYDQQVSVYDFVVSPGCNTNECVLSEIIRVKGDYQLANSSEPTEFSIIVKQLPKDPFSRFFVTKGQFDLREIKFYTKVVPDLIKLQEKQLSEGKAKTELPVPSCIYGKYIPQSGTDDSPIPSKSILVLEDLHSSNYRRAEFSKGLTLDQARLALSAIARIHAHSLAMKVLGYEHLSRRYTFLFETEQASDSYQQLVERGLPQLAQFLESRPGLETVLEALMALRPKTKDIIAALLAPEGPLALITHTDFWCDNLLFKNDPTNPDCRILDWQMVTYSRPTNDIALLLISSVPTDLRRNHTCHLLDTYWEALNNTSTDLGVSIKDLGYKREELDFDYRRSQLLALLLCIGSVDVALGDPLTEQRLLDVLQDLYNDGVLTDENVFATSQEAN